MSTPQNSDSGPDVESEKDKTGTAGTTGQIGQTSPSGESGIGQKFQAIFLSHPASIGESYFEHQRNALGFSVKLIWTGLAALIHALIPALCVNTARDNIEELHNKLQSRSSSRNK